MLLVLFLYGKSNNLSSWVAFSTQHSVNAGVIKRAFFEDTCTSKYTGLLGTVPCSTDNRDTLSELRLRGQLLPGSLGEW